MRLLSVLFLVTIAISTARSMEFGFKYSMGHRQENFNEESIWTEVLLDAMLHVVIGSYDEVFLAHLGCMKAVDLVELKEWSNMSDMEKTMWGHKESSTLRK